MARSNGGANRNLPDVCFGSKAEIRPLNQMSALPPKADIRRFGGGVRLVPEADMRPLELALFYPSGSPEARSPLQ